MRSRIAATIAVVAALVSLAGGIAGPLYAAFGAS
ncbi:putative small lipoprotein YifL [Actinoplanes couchii]|nr:putative small lipoprotein YifL [Actinoplanes couchii]